MLYRLTNSQFDFLVENSFRALEFKNGGIYYFCDKFTRSSLVTLCSLLYNKLQMCPSVVNGTWNLAPACSWVSLPYRDLYALSCVLLMDCLQMYCCYAPRVIDAYVDSICDAPFASFVSSSKIDVELPVSVATIYFYDGKKFYSESDLWDYVHKQYPQSKYNVSLKF